MGIVLILPSGQTAEQSLSLAAFCMCQALMELQRWKLREVGRKWHCWHPGHRYNTWKYVWSVVKIWLINWIAGWYLLNVWASPPLPRASVCSHFLPNKLAIKKKLNAKTMSAPLSSSCRGWNTLHNKSQWACVTQGPFQRYLRGVMIDWGNQRCWWQKLIQSTRNIYSPFHICHKSLKSCLLNVAVSVHQHPTQRSNSTQRGPDISSAFPLLSSMG